MVHLLQVVIRADNREHRFEGRSTEGAALVVAFRDWLSQLEMPMAVGADTLEQVVWSGAKERAGTAEVVLSSERLAGSSLSDAAIEGKG